MARFENTSDLFGVGSGQGTDRGIDCQWCKHSYSETQETICFTNFGDLQICDCCFEKVENTVLRHMPEILPWFIRILTANEKHTKGMQDLLKRLKEALAVVPT